MNAIDEKRPDLRVMRADGSFVVRETFTFVCYFQTPHANIAPIIADAIRGYATLIGFDALACYYDDAGDAQKLGRESLNELIESRFFSSPDIRNANLILSSDSAGAREHYLWYNGKDIPLPAFPNEAGYLHFWMPRAFFLERREVVLKFIYSFVRRLPFSFAHASLGLAERNKHRMQALAARYRGLDISLPLAVSADIGYKAAGAYWMCFLGPELSRAVGTIESLREAMPTEIAFAQLDDDKIAIRLSPDPIAGDVNRRDRLSAHEAFAQYLDRRSLLHVPRRVTYFVDDDGLADLEAQVAWHRRFVANGS
jgi:hypothetical protein